MAELATILEQNNIPSKRLIHDSVDTGNNLVLTDGVTINFPCDGAARNYKSGGDLWDSVNSIITDSIDDNEIKVKLKTVLNGSVNTICRIDVIVPHPTFGDIEIDSQEVVMYKNNTDTVFTNFFLLYNGTDSEAKTYGFKVKLTADGGNLTLKGRSILVTA